MVNALNAGNSEQLRGNFIRDARVGALPAKLVFDAVAPFLKEIHSRGNLRFAQLQEPDKVEKHRCEADFTVVYYLEGDDSMPYRRAPVEIKGRVTLQRLGWFRWRIARISSPDEEFQQAINALVMQYQARQLLNLYNGMPGAK